MTNKPTVFQAYMKEMTIANILAKDITLDEMIRDMSVFMARGGYGIDNDTFEIIRDHIDMLSHQDNNKAPLVEQIAQANNLFDACTPFAIRNEKQENERS